MVYSVLAAKHRLRGTIMSVSGDHDPRRRLAGYRDRWSALSLLSKILLGLSLLSSLGVGVIVVYVVYMIIFGYSGGNDPTSINALAIPLAFLVLFFIGVPSMLVCGLLWGGYAVSRRRSARPSGPARRRRSGD